MSEARAADGILESPLGLVFVDRAGRVLVAEYDPQDWRDPEDFPAANGWEVGTLSGCCGSTVFPEYAPG